MFEICQCPKGDITWKFLWQVPRAVRQQDTVLDAEKGPLSVAITTVPFSPLEFRFNVEDRSLHLPRREVVE